MVGDRRGMIGVAVGQHRAALVGEIADGVVGVTTILLRLIGPEGAGRMGEAV